MSKPLQHIVTDKLWADYPPKEKIRLFNLLVIAATVQIIALIYFVMNLFAPVDSSCIICNIGMLLTPVLSLVFLIRGKAGLALNTIFLVPLFVYAYYISDFSNHPPLSETVHTSLWWLLAGLFLLFYFSESTSRIIYYFILAFSTLSYQLAKANWLIDSFSDTEPTIGHPLIILSVAFVGLLLLRNSYNRVVTEISESLKSTKHLISKTVQESKFPIVQIKAERDETGNVDKLWFEKVNNSFEATFKKNLYEIQGQEAGYIFDLILLEHFDLNNFLFLDKRKTREYHAKKLDRWFKINVINPNQFNYYLIFEDITKAKKKVQELESSRKRYKVLLEAIPDMFFVIGKDGVYEDFVIKESDLFKVEDANVVGSTIYDVGFPQKMANRIHKLIQYCIKNNSLETIEYSLNTPNGTYLYEMRLAKLSARSVISVARDITKRKTAEFDLEKAKRKAEESDRLKSAFLANLSHEIRTPLNIITNFTRILAESELEDMEKLELSDAISQNGKQLLNMIDNTIHLSKIETNSVDVKMKFSKINTIVRDIYNRFMPIIPESKSVRMRVNLDVPNPVFGFNTDSRLLTETLEILIDNAIKFTQKGEINLGYEMVRNEHVKFVVSDTGIGIPEEEVENIFSRFYRINNEINELTSGSGLGLPIAQHYVSLLGGTLEMESTPGKGTKFWFTLPFRDGEGFLKVVS